MNDSFYSLDSFPAERVVTTAARLASDHGIEVTPAETRRILRCLYRKLHRDAERICQNELEECDVYALSENQLGEADLRRRELNHAKLFVLARTYCERMGVEHKTR